jgi:hypothetical protein
MHTSDMLVPTCALSCCSQQTCKVHVALQTSILRLKLEQHLSLWGLSEVEHSSSAYNDEALAFISPLPDIPL